MALCEGEERGLVLEFPLPLSTRTAAVACVSLMLRLVSFGAASVDHLPPFIVPGGHGGCVRSCSWDCLHIGLTVCSKFSLIVPSLCIHCDCFEQSGNDGTVKVRLRGLWRNRTRRNLLSPA